jgi:hypothetical protein
MERIISLVPTGGPAQAQKLDMFNIQWIHNTADEWNIVIYAKNAAVGQRGVRIKTSGGAADQTRLSEFHDKLLTALAGFNTQTQITAYTGLATLPPGEIIIDLKTMLVYLIINF